MTSMSASAPASQQSSEHERVPLRHGLTAVIIRYRDDEERPQRPTARLKRPDVNDQQRAAFDAYMANQAGGPTGNGAA